MNALSLDTVVLADNKKEMIILDQTLLPGEIKYLTLSKAEDIWEAIYALRVARRAGHAWPPATGSISSLHSLRRTIWTLL